MRKDAGISYNIKTEEQQSCHYNAVFCCKILYYDIHVSVTRTTLITVVADQECHPPTHSWHFFIAAIVWCQSKTNMYRGKRLSVSFIYVAELQNLSFASSCRTILTPFKTRVLILWISIQNYAIKTMMRIDTHLLRVLTIKLAHF